MDTDELTKEAYNAIMVTAERFHSDLTLQFGLLSYHCNDEDDFLEKSKSLVLEMMNSDEYELDDIFYENPPNIDDFRKVLKQILINIEEVIKIPYSKRTPDII